MDALWSVLRPGPTLVFLCGFLTLGPVTAEAQQGIARVVDGDTLHVGQTRVRLHGIDAPELDQTCMARNAAWGCGLWARRELAARVEGRHLSCEAVDRDVYGRIVAKCFLGGEDIGRALVRDGVALAYRKYSWDYDLEEKSAAVAGIGLHGAQVRNPAVVRQERRAPSGGTAANGDCVIKGNISRNGKRIYHLPHQEYYARTRISPRKGERWFCNEDEARAAGWRRARR